MRSILGLMLLSIKEGNGYGLRVTGYGLQVTGYGLQVTGYGLFLIFSKSRSAFLMVREKEWMPSRSNWEVA